MTSGGDLPLFAARLRAHRAEHDYSLAEIAHRLRRLSREVEDGVECGATAKTVWRWEHGERPGARYRRLLSALYDATPERLGFVTAPDSALAPAATLAAAEDDDVRRRTFLGVLGGAVLGPFEHRLAGLDPTAARVPSGRDVDEWERAADAYAHEMATAARGRLLPHLLTDFNDVHELLGDGRLGAHQCQRLARVAAQLAAHVADALIGLGEHAASRRWLRAARSAADDAGDPALAASVRGRQAMRALYAVYYAPTSALDLADEAVASARGTSCAGVVEALATRAQAHAAMGRGKEARSALADLAAAFERLPDDVTREDAAFLGWSEQRFRHVESYVYTHLGDSRRADQAQEQALALYPATAWRGPTQIQLHRAMCLVHDGHITDGIGHATASIQALPPERRRDGFIQTIAHATAAAVPASARALPPVREYRELLALPPVT